MSNNVRVEIFAAGDGINYPRAGNTVTVHYTGFLPDNSTFDSSRDRKKPFKFKLGADQVIPGNFVVAFVYYFLVISSLFRTGFRCGSIVHR